MRISESSCKLHLPVSGVPLSPVILSLQGIPYKPLYKPESVVQSLWYRIKKYFRSRKTPGVDQEAVSRRANRLEIQSRRSQLLPTRLTFRKKLVLRKVGRFANKFPVKCTTPYPTIPSDEMPIKACTLCKGNSHRCSGCQVSGSSRTWQPL